MPAKPAQRTWIDSIALYDALDDERLARALSWRELARDMDITPSFFTRLKEGRVPDTRNVCRACDWLGAKIDDFRAPEGERLPLSRPRLSDEILFQSLTPGQIAEINRNVFGADYDDEAKVAAS